MGKSAHSKTLGTFILKLALGVMLILAGIWALQGGGDFGAQALKSLLGKNFGVIFGVVELVAGVLLIIESFTRDFFGKFDNILGIIIMLVWLVAIVVGDIIKGDFDPFLTWLHTFASHVIILCGLWTVND